MNKKITLAALFALCLLLGGVASMFLQDSRPKKKKVSIIQADPIVLKAKLEQQPPEWMMRQIRSDLAPYRNGISHAVIDRTLHGKNPFEYQVVRLCIYNRQITTAQDQKLLGNRRFLELLACVNKLNELTKLPNVDLLISLGDGFTEDPGLGPCLVFAKGRSAEGLILCPDINAMGGYNKVRPTILEGNKQWEWARKIPLVFWRGGTTGGFFSKDHWKEYARSKLVLFSLAHPEAVDARFHKAVQAEIGFEKYLKEQGAIAESVDKVDHLKYKYLIDIDGNSCTYERLFWLLLSNSLVIKQVTPNVQWYYGALEPYVHYVPVKEDLSDLMDQIAWARTHDAQAQQIAEEGSRFAQENLSAEATLVYLYHLIREYAKLQQKAF